MSIEADFFAHMAAAFPTTPIAYPGVDFAPPRSGQWFELSVFRAQPIDGVPADFSPMLQGELQVTICDRPGTGLISLVTAADSVAAALPNGTKFNDGLRTSQTPYQLSIIIESDRIALPVSVRFST